MMTYRRSTAWALVAAALTTAVAQTAGSEKFGGGVPLAEVTSLETVLEKPSSYEGKTVRVEGVVTAVCDEMGCWMALAPTAKSEKALLIQVAHDGVVVFPMSAKGKRAAAQGTVERNGRHGRAAAKEHADHRGEAEPEAVAGWQIQATGALVF